MSKINELIQTLCPDGVEYKKLGEVAEYAKGRIPATNVDENTYVGVDNLLQNCRGVKESTNVPAEGTVIQFLKKDILIGNIRPYLKKAWLADRDGGTNSDVLAIRVKDENEISSDFLYVILSSDAFFEYDMLYAKGAKMPRGDKNVVMMYPIPVPPLPVQDEIVRILDEYTDLEAELEAKLSEEIELKQKQYEVYRDELLTFGDDVERKRLGDVAEIGTGSRNTQDAVENGQYDFFVRSQTPLRLNEYDYDDESVVTAGDGVGVGKVFHITHGKYALHQRAYRIHPLDKLVLDVKYLYYVFANNFYAYIMMQKYNGSVASVRLPMLKAFDIPVPPLQEQERIVKILDKYDTYTRDMISTLNTELESRKKQYAYYRDKLLTFKRKE